MKHCVVVPCYGHNDTVAAVAGAALEHAPVIVVDDGSATPIPPIEGCVVVRLPTNSGKGAALRAGFERAVADGFSHALTMDADGQHSASDVPRVLAASRAQPNALIVGVRDFASAGGPAGRRRSNAVAAFWLWVETKRRLADTQCGLRCYALEQTDQLRVTAGHYAFEYEYLVRCIWAGIPVETIDVQSTYGPGHISNSRFRLADLAHLIVLNIGLVAQAWFVPAALRRAWSLGKNPRPRRVLAELFSEHAEDPLRMSLAVGLGLFFGTAPIWGYQMIAVATVAHWLKLNKPIALLASNISIPPIAPFIVVASVILGNGIADAAGFGAAAVTMPPGPGLLGRWVVGSIALGTGLAIAGTAITYVAARVLRRHEQ